MMYTQVWFWDLARWWFSRTYTNGLYDCLRLSLSMEIGQAVLPSHAIYLIPANTPVNTEKERAIKWYTGPMK